MWHKGTVGGYAWEAKVYEQPSRFGIRQGRISKLRVQSLLGDDLVCSYGRGMDFSRLSDASLARILAHIEETV